MSRPTVNVEPSQIPTPSADGISPTSEEPDFSNEPGPPPYIAHFDGKSWELRIGQQPVRARMCGFGDKDRRPISPPPCIQLIVTDLSTGEVVDFKKLDLTLFVLTVDLWDKDAKKETNLVKSATNSPSISSVSVTGYPQTVHPSYGTMPHQTQAYSGPGMHQYAAQHYTSPISATPSSASSYSYPPDPTNRYSNGDHHPVHGYSPQYYRHDSYSRSSMGSIGPNGYGQTSASSMQPPPSPYRTGEQYDFNQYTHPNLMGGQAQQSSGMFTRNLIGNLSASAFKLKDPEEHDGIWFVMQDLSIRTEGWFRLKFSFVNLGKTDGLGQENTPNTENGNKQRNGSTASGAGSDDSSGSSASRLVDIGENAPCLATCYSAPFHVWSAKKFPGVIESTDLSKKFAQQGIKIPIRKEGKDGEASGGRTKRKRGPDDYDDGEDADNGSDGMEETLGPAE